jgi:hypothetical protein
VAVFRNVLRSCSMVVSRDRRLGSGALRRA